MDSIANKLGMLHPGKGTNTVRAVFVVDPVQSAAGPSIIPRKQQEHGRLYVRQGDDRIRCQRGSDSG